MNRFPRSYPHRLLSGFETKRPANLRFMGLASRCCMYLKLFYEVRCFSVRLRSGLPVWLSLCTTQPLRSSKPRMLILHP